MVLLAAGAILLGAGLLLMLWSEAGEATSRDYDGRPVLRVLFIGNSLTGSALPPLVMKMSIAVDSGPVIEATARVAADSSLADHLPGAQTQIAKGDWSFVVLQQGPSSLPESRAQLLEYARVYDPMIRSAGARPALYMVWPEQARYSAIDRVCESYRLAAQEIDALLLPVGEAWRIALAKDSSLPLYSADRFHPSPAGTYLAALVICSGLTGKSALELPGPEELGVPAQLTPQQVQVLQAAAEESLEEAATASPEPGKTVP